MPLNENIERLLKAREKKPKKVYKGIAKKSAKKIAEEKEAKRSLTEDETIKERWFKNRRKELVGVCQ